MYILGLRGGVGWKEGSMYTYIFPSIQPGMLYYWYSMCQQVFIVKTIHVHILYNYIYAKQLVSQAQYESV